MTSDSARAASALRKAGQRPGAIGETARADSTESWGSRPRTRAQRAEAAFRAHYGTIDRFLLRETGSHHDAEELTQEVFADTAAVLHGERGTDASLAGLYLLARRRLGAAPRRGRRPPPPR